MKFIFLVLLGIFSPYYLISQLTSLQELDTIRARCIAKYPELGPILTPLNDIDELEVNQILNNDSFFDRKKRLEGFIKKYSLPISPDLLWYPRERKKLSENYSPEQIEDWLSVISLEGKLPDATRYLDYKYKLLALLPQEDTLLQNNLLEISENPSARYVLTYLSLSDSIRKALMSTSLELAKTTLEDDPSYRRHYTFYQYCTQARLGDTIAENVVIKAFKNKAYAGEIDGNQAKKKNDEIDRIIAPTPIEYFSIIQLGKLLYWIDTPKSRTVFWEAFTSPHIILYQFRDDYGKCYVKQISLMGLMLKIYRMENHNELNYLQKRILNSTQLKINDLGNEHLNRIASNRNSKWYYYECVAIWLSHKHGFKLKIQQHFDQSSPIGCEYKDMLK